ncbi:hypothetical protein K3495_g9657 [Podosphaera aphanis]|nr:hypothetical protein K3495_g9657 [Podosphaera aphanis]
MASKCGQCAGGHNTRECKDKQETRCSNCGRKHPAWDIRCPTKLAPKAKAVQNRVQDAGRHSNEAVQPRNCDSDWQIVGSKKRHTEPVPRQAITFTGDGIRPRAPGRPRSDLELGATVRNVFMKGTLTSNITQYSVNKIKDRVQQHFLQMLDPLKHHVVALQEPWCHPTEFTTVKHPAYHLVFPDGQKSRTCIYVISQKEGRTIVPMTSFLSRAAVSEAAQDPTKIWKLAKWARKDPEERHRLPQVPDVKGADGTIYIEALDKANIMAHHFFPQPVAADTRDIDESTYPEDLPNISDVITQTEIKEILQKLASDKASGPAGIPNRFLKCCESSLSRIFKESTTIVLRRPQKPRYDTPKSYRPIAPLNIMGKLLEKLVANRISKATKEFNLLPEEQMGARPKRYTISTVELLTGQIHTFWGKDKKKVASLLSLDIPGAFDNVSHKRLIHNLREKGIPRWICNFVKSFLEERTTSIVLGSFKGKRMPTSTGIPQG